MTGSLIPLAFEGQSVRAVGDEEAISFVADDVCSVLNVHRTQVRKLEDDEKGVCLIHTPGGAQEVLTLTEAGVYTLVLRCRDAMKPGTAPYKFRKWVTGTALPALRRGHDVSTGLSAPDRGAIGGIVKGIVNKALSETLPALVQEALLSHRYAIVEGVSALEVAEIAGYNSGQRPRGAIQFITRRLGRYHEDRAVPIKRSKHGSGKVRLFDESTARAWLRAGGKAEIDHYIAERKGQGKLRLISAH